MLFRSPTLSSGVLQDIRESLYRRESRLFVLGARGVAYPKSRRSRAESGFSRSKGEESRYPSVSGFKVGMEMKLKSRGMHAFRKSRIPLSFTLSRRDFTFRRTQYARVPRADPFISR